MDSQATDTSALIGASIALAMVLAGWVVGRLIVRIFRIRTGWSRVVVAVFMVLGGTLSRPLAAKILSPQSRPPTLEEALLEVPVFQTLARYYPEDYRKVIEVASQQQGATVVESIRRASPEILAVIERQMPKASDANVIANLRSELEELKFARSYSIRLCAEEIAGGVAVHADLTKVYPVALRRRKLEAIDDILVQTATRPVVSKPLRFPSREQTRIAKGARSTLPADEQALVSRTDQVRDNFASEPAMRAYCDLTVAALEQILMLPPGKAAALYRSFYFPDAGP